jgi:hypothetical protein
LQHDVDDIAAHLLGAVRARADMAMQAGLVASIPDVDLQCVEPPAANRRERDFIEKRQGLMHSPNLAEPMDGVIPRESKSM